MKRPNSLTNRANRRSFVKSSAAALASVAISPFAESVAQHASAGPNGKKGFCCLVQDDRRWLNQIEALRARWFYSWGPNKPDEVPDGVEFAPMIWGKPGNKSQTTLDRIKRQGASGEVKWLMGFNEPDQHDQSNLTVEEALDAWPRLMEVGLPLASPGCVHADRQWMIDFMKGVKERSLRVDYVCVHSYGGPSANALLARLEKIHRMFDRPLWVTEFAVGDWTAKTPQQNKHKPPQIARFMREVLPMLNKAQFVDRYAWYSAKQDNRALGTSALFDSKGELTELGEIYRSM